MKGDARQALLDELDDPLPAGLELLDAREMADLAAALRGARERQAAAIDQALEDALQQIPWILRSTARKAMLG